MAKLKKQVTSITNHPHLKRWNTLLKTVMALLFGYLLYQTITARKDMADIYSTFADQLGVHQLPYLLAVLLIMPVNWWVEAVKWQKLHRPIIPIALTQSIKAVLVGLAASLFTPNRIGEYAGRVFMSPRGHRWKAAAGLMLGSWIQMSIIALFGLAAMAHLSVQLDIIWLRDGLLALTLLGVVLSIFGYFKVGAIISWLQDRALPRRLARLLTQVTFVTQYKRGQLATILLLTIARVLIYAVQYYLMARFFGVQAGAVTMLAAIFVNYFMQMSIPIPPMVALLARGEMALLAWNFSGANELSVVAASYSLWVINVLVPSLVGMIVVLKQNILTIHQS